MSKAFDRAWNIAKSENVYHSVHITPRNESESATLWELEQQLLRRGISFETGATIGGGRDWELDFSLKGATADEVMSELRDTGIPFETKMWVDEGGTSSPSSHQAALTDYADGGVIAGQTNCPECGQNAMLIQESPEMGGGITLGCNECGFTDPEFEGMDDDGEGMVA